MGTLREAILSGEFQDGQDLNQVELAARFGVSRVPVREALRELQAEGLVLARAHHQVVVQGIPTERLNEIFRVRILLERHLLEAAVPRSTAPHLRRLERLFAELVQEREHREWLRKNREFHRALYEPSGAHFIMRLVEQLAVQHERYLLLRSAGQGVPRSRDADNEHHAILEAVGEHDVELACALLEIHIARTRRSLLNYLSQQRRPQHPSVNGASRRG